MEKLKNEETIKEMSLEDKIKLCSGEGFWNTEEFKKYGIEEIFFSDGPHGLRKQEKKGDHLGVNDSKPATCFPSAALSSCTWDETLIAEMGKAIGEEARAYGVDVVLGPGVNIKRNPLCGRNFEYFSEDPILSGKMAVAWIKGLQSTGVGASLKHFLANNIENERLLSDSIIDERTLREIYLLPFEIAVKEAKPDTVMSAYNKLNGTYLSDNSYVLREILRQEWGFKKVILTDWGGMNDKVQAFKAGLDLEMPSSGKLFDKEVIKAVKHGSLDERYINEAVDRIITLVKEKVAIKKNVYKYDKEKHHKLALKIAEEGAILLKNENDILPIKNKSIAIVGAMAEEVRYQGTGSSHINPRQLTNIIDGLKKAQISYDYYPAYEVNGNKNEALLKAALEGASKSEVVIVVIGIPEHYESEGYDRNDMKLPENQLQLLNKLKTVNNNVVAVLLAGAPVEMEWLTSVKALLNMYLAGQALGEATVKILFGEVNPCGKLAESYPMQYKDNVSAEIFSVSPRQQEYREGIYVGYRYYDKAKIKVRFPFGFGLSYTSFQYSNIKVSKEVLNEGDSLQVSCQVKNIGQFDGKEIVQVYLADKRKNIYRAVKELKAFKKIELKIGEEKEVVFNLAKRDFAYYDVTFKEWIVPSGEYEILIAASSEDIRLRKTIIVHGSNKDNLKEAPAWYINPQGYPKKEEFEILYGKKIAEYKGVEKGNYDLNCTLNDMKDVALVKVITNCIRQYLRIRFKCAGDSNCLFMYKHLVSTPLIRLVQQRGHTSLMNLMKAIVFTANKF